MAWATGRGWPLHRALPATSQKHDGRARCIAHPFLHGGARDGGDSLQDQAG